MFRPFYTTTSNVESLLVLQIGSTKGAGPFALLSGMYDY